MTRLVGVGKRYRGRPPVLRGVDLELVAGTATLVTGANGSGKSTLLTIAAGCVAPTSGRVTGRPAVVGYLPSPFPASAQLTAPQYLAHLARVHGGAVAGPAALLAELGFTGAADVPVSRLSTGNAQKVGLAQALGSGPGLVVLDEPWTGLDEQAAAALDRLVRAATERGAAVLVADHGGRPAAVPAVAVLNLHDGRLTPVRRAPAHPGPVTAMRLRCPPAGREVVLGAPAAVVVSSDGDELVVRVPAEQADALLGAALHAGCSVRAVWQEPR